MKFVRQENTHTQKPFLQLWGWISFVSHFSLLIGTGTLYCIKDEDSSIMHTPLLYCSLVKKIYFSNDSYSLLCWPRKFKIKFLIYLSLFDQPNVLVFCGVWMVCAYLLIFMVALILSISPFHLFYIKLSPLFCLNITTTFSTCCARLCVRGCVRVARIPNYLCFASNCVSIFYITNISIRWVFIFIINSIKRY